jgi:hypothetical protein
VLFLWPSTAKKFIIVLVVVPDPAAQVTVYWSDRVLAYCGIERQFSHALRPSKKM